MSMEASMDKEKNELNTCESTSNQPEQPSKQETKPELLKKKKIFFVSDMDEEARFLHTMSLSGYHFTKKDGITYYFELGTVKNYYYHLGYYEHGVRDEDRYVSNFKDAGWDSVYHEKGEFDGILHYFRTEEEAGAAEPSIYSENRSRKDLYKRLLASWRNLITMIIICMIAMVGFFYFLLTHPTIYQTAFMITLGIVSCLLIFGLVLYLCIYQKVRKKLEEFKYL